MSPYGCLHATYVPQRAREVREVSATRPAPMTPALRTAMCEGGMTKKLTKLHCFVLFSLPPCVTLPLQSWNTQHEN